MSRRRLHSIGKVYLLCLLLVLLLQIPISWLLAALSWRSEPQPEVVSIMSPIDMTSDAETLHIYSTRLFGARRIQILAHAPTGSRYGKVYRTRSAWLPPRGQLEALCAPWAPEDVHPVLGSTAAWPAITGADPSFGVPIAHRIANGWPWPCAQGRIDYDASTRQFSTEGAFFGPDWLRPHPANGPVFCYRPRWPGYVANSLVQAGLLTVLIAFFAGVPALRAALRRRRGKCPTCAYDLRATPPFSSCPECGTHLR
ncbi:MAG: hypothetical protein KF745_11905 [Phycisphaeraceae bacterium]|nr:hypothetical protein [Phycisphaeraceae bacterium]